MFAINIGFCLSLAINAALIIGMIADRKIIKKLRDDGKRFYLARNMELRIEDNDRFYRNLNPKTNAEIVKKLCYMQARGKVNSEIITMLNKYRDSKVKNKPKGS